MDSPQIILGGVVVLVAGMTIWSAYQIHKKAWRNDKNITQSREELSRIKASAYLALQAQSALKKENEDIKTQQECELQHLGSIREQLMEATHKIELLTGERRSLEELIQARAEHYRTLDDSESKLFADKRAKLEQDFQKEQASYEEKMAELESTIKDKEQLVLALQKQLVEDDAVISLQLSAEDVNLIKLIENQLAPSLPLKLRSGINKLIWENIVRPSAKNVVTDLTGGAKVSGIYRITNLTNGKFYIGRSVNVGDRLYEHIKSALGVGSSRQDIHKIMSEDLNNWGFEILEEVEPNKLSEREKFYIDFYNSNVYGYNRQRGG